MSEDTRGQGGEFRGDFTRDTFDPSKNFTRVLMQQGRVQLDADWNEQVSILHHYMRQLGEDLMGPHAVPADAEGNAWPGFEITESGSDFSIGIGRYYVKGILCENKANLTYLTQEPHPLVELEGTGEGEQYLVYLDAWERNLSFVEDDSIREKALGGADTAMRSKIVWQVRVIEWDSLLGTGVGLPTDLSTITATSFSYTKFNEALLKADKAKPGQGKLRARAKKVSDENKDPCLTAPEASYRGAENQLYRVEIHNSGKAKKEGGNGGNDCATFKWSRENGAVLFPIINSQIAKENDRKVVILELEHLGRDDRFGLEVNDWVEVVNRNVTLQSQANPLLQVTQVDKEKNQVFLSLNKEQGEEEVNGLLSADPTYLRRWDQKNNKEGGRGVLTVSEQADNWIPLENGIEIQFENEEQYYQTGDYWLIPARTATGDVEWPVDPENKTQPAALLSNGVQHYYAPLAIIKVDSTSVKLEVDLRRKLQKGWE